MVVQELGILLRGGGYCDPTLLYISSVIRLIGEYSKYPGKEVDILRIPLAIADSTHKAKATRNCLPG